MVFQLWVVNFQFGDLFFGRRQHNAKFSSAEKFCVMVDPLAWCIYMSFLDKIIREISLTYTSKSCQVWAEKLNWFLGIFRYGELNPGVIFRIWMQEGGVLATAVAEPGLCFMFFSCWDCWIVCNERIEFIGHSIKPIEYTKTGTSKIEFSGKHR